MKIQTQPIFPQQLKYAKVVPKGYPSIYKQWINDPLTGNKTWARNDIVRFNFMNSKRGTFDPYRSFLQITVSVSPQNMPVGLLQVDNSAHSFINQMVVYSNNRQVERITQYSVLLAYLNDIGMNQFLTEGRQTQGLGYASHDTMPHYKGLNNITQAARTIYTPGKPTNTMTYSSGLNFPTIGNNWYQESATPINNSIVNVQKSVKGHITNANPFIYPQDNVGGTYNPPGFQPGDPGLIPFKDYCLTQFGYLNNFRSQYYANIINGKFPQSTQSIPSWQTKLSQSVSKDVYPFYFDPKAPYVPYFTKDRHAYLQGSTGGTYVDTQVNCANYGFQNLYSPFYTKGTFQPFISPTVPQVSIQNGQILPSKIPIYRRKFKIPIASAVMGCLIQPTSYNLLPLQSINDVLMQLTLDQYAMFTSGYNDVCQVDTTGMKIQQGRVWDIQRIQYKIHTYFFVDNQIQQYIRTSLYQQITVVNNFWALGNQFQIQGGNLVNNTYIVGSSSNHLNQIVCLFVPNDYQKYSFCRKHFRISNNIRRFWSKLAVDYWPPQPHKGNGGNVASNNIDDDNSIFVQNIYWANNYMFSKSSLPRINTYNFAVNDRCYDPTNTATFYPPQSYSNPNATWGSTSVNADTALGMPYIHQNRYIGKAAYILMYTPFIAQSGLLQGVNVSGLSTFEVVFETDSTQTFSRDQTLYIFCKSSVVVKYTKQGILTYGR